MDSHIRQQIINNIYSNRKNLISGDKLQEVLLAMFDRDVFLTEEEYEALVQAHLIDEDKIYHIYEE